MKTVEQKAQWAAYMREWNHSPAGKRYHESHKKEHAEWNRNWNHANIEKRRRQNRASYQRRKEFRSTYDKNYAAKHPEIIKAEWAAWSAARKGILVRPSCCSDCKISCRPEAHHHKGYQKEFWLDVIWLCVRCHRKAHKG